MAQLGGYGLGTVRTERHNKRANLFTQPMPLSDSDETLLMDIFGVTRTITIEGTYTGSLSAIRTFILNIESIHNGSQSGSTFSSDLTGNDYTVAIDSFDFSWQQGETVSLSYSLTLKEGSVI